MASEHDILSRLPEAPAPEPDARQAAITNALERFEEKNRPRGQGNEQDLRLTQQTAVSNSPSRRRAFMPRARQLVAASLVALMAGSATWFYVHETSVVQLPETIVYEPSNKGVNDGIQATRADVSSPPVVQDRVAETAPPVVQGAVPPSPPPQTSSSQGFG